MNRSFTDWDSVLMHYGVPGMRKGFRKDGKPSEADIARMRQTAEQRRQQMMSSGYIARQIKLARAKGEARAAEAARNFVAQRQQAQATTNQAKKPEVDAVTGASEQPRKRKAQITSRRL